MRHADSGEHSETRHRNAIEKSWNALGKAVAADSDAKRADAAAAAAAATTTTTRHRYTPETVANRIDTLSAEQRADQRALDGHIRTLFTDAHGHKHREITHSATGDERDRVIARMAQRGADIAWWQSVRAEQIVAGEAGDYSRDTIAKGDAVRERHTQWLRVRRVDAKSVTVDYPLGDRTFKYTHITGHVPTRQSSDTQAES